MGNKTTKKPAVPVELAESWDEADGRFRQALRTAQVIPWDHKAALAVAVAADKLVRQWERLLWASNGSDWQWIAVHTALLDTRAAAAYWRRRAALARVRPAVLRRLLTVAACRREWEA